MKFEFIHECLIFRPKEIQSPEDLEALNSLLDGMANRSCFEYWGVDQTGLSQLQKKEWVVALVDECRRDEGIEFIAYKRRSDINPNMLRCSTKGWMRQRA